MNFEDVIRERFSTRSFKDEKVSKEQLDKILEAGRIAPTAKNSQPIKIYVIESDEALNKINDCSPCIYGAKTVLLVCGNKETSFHKGAHSSHEIDASIVATHMILEATNLGVDSVWVGMFDDDKVKETFNLEYEPVCIIPLGYHTDDYKPSPMHSTRKDISEIVEYL